MVEEMQMERAIVELTRREAEKIESLIREFADAHGGDLSDAMMVWKRTPDGFEWKIVEGRHEQVPSGRKN